MEPHYFGTFEKRLLGIYYPPRGKPRSHGVVLCPPGPQEYMSTHMAFRKLAAMLGRERFHVHKFDYFGTGDSAGASGEGSLTEWQRNIISAVDDLKDLSGVTKVSLVGLRLGASLAALTPVEIDSLVLWRPVIKGTTYLDELRRLHVRAFSGLLHPPAVKPRRAGGELLGFPLAADMEIEIERIDLFRPLMCRPEHIVLVADEQTAELVELEACLRKAGPAQHVTSECHYVPDDSRSDQPDAMLLATRVLQVMTGALAQRPD